MERINPTRIANRIGRIVFATILAGVFVGTLSLFNPDYMDSPTGGGTVFDIYVSALVEVAITPVLVGFIVLPTILVYWGLSNRVSWTQKWQILLGGAVVVAVAWAVGDNSGVVDITLATLAKVVYGCAILTAISTTESLSGRDVTLAPRQLATGTGALALVFVVLVPAAAIGAGVVSDGDRYASEGSSFDAVFNPDPTDPAVYDNGNESPYVTSPTPQPAESSVVTVNPDGTPTLPTDEQLTYDSPAATVVTNASIVTVSNVTTEVRGETVVPQARYYVELEGVNTSFARYYQSGTYNTTLAGSGDYAGATVFHGSHLRLEGGFYLEMEQTESTHVYADFITDGGEIHRYVFKLERTDV